MEIKVKKVTEKEIAEKKITELFDEYSEENVLDVLECGFKELEKVKKETVIKFAYFLIGKYIKNK